MRAAGHTGALDDRPLLATSLASLAGWPVHSWVPFRNRGEWVIGAALGLYCTPDVGRPVAVLVRVEPLNRWRVRGAPA